jgi:hypothetical protein
MIGKRIIVFWTDAARESGSDWPAFRVIDELPKGYYCEGITAPDGTTHDGSTAFIEFLDTHDIIEWKEGA